MAGAYTTLKVSPEEHQALLALLRFLAGKIPEDQFRAVLKAQGRRIPDEMPLDKFLGPIADQLLGSFS